MTLPPVRVRFAPSPTGFLHVGGARTALFNWLFARHHGGTFVLRIEDTDRNRSDAAMTAAILEGMTWLGLDWDEGPLHQADGTDRHRADALRLLHSGAAYRCFCSPLELEQRRAEAAAAAAYRYDRRCADLAAAESARRADSGAAHVIRFLVPPGTTSWTDAVHGEIEFANADIEDFIILRSDGTPIYNMAVVSDDAAMGITHVIRGDDHISNTPKQILLHRALGYALPVFAHVPMILGSDGRRLSKRHGATAIGEYQQQGILPDALCNFLALLGWSTGTDEEILTRAELVRRFSLDGINRKSAIFDTARLEWMNGQYLRAASPETLWPAIECLLSPEWQAALRQRPRHWTLRVLALLQPRARTILELATMLPTYLEPPAVYDPEAVARHWKDPQAVASRLAALRQVWAGTDWQESELEAGLRQLADASGTGAARIIHPLRLALTGSGASPGIFEVAIVLGRDETLRRIDAALRRLDEGGRSAGAA